jgi:hypothetical protein
MANHPNRSRSFDALAALVRAEQANIDSHMQTAARFDAERDAGLIQHHVALALAAARRQEAHRAEIGRRFPARVGV